MFSKKRGSPFISEDRLPGLKKGGLMIRTEVKHGKSLKIAACLTTVIVSVIGLAGFFQCSRNNPLDPKAGDYDPGVNLLVDPGFENQDTTHWRGAISGGRSIVNTGAHNGTSCEQMVMDTNGYPRSVWQTVQGITAGKVYSVSGWMKTQSIVFSVHIAVYWYNTPDPPASQGALNYIHADTLGVFKGTNAWTKFEKNYFAPDSAQSAQFFLEGVAVKHSSSTGDLGTVWFDDLSLIAR
jgi:hypothetical protein